jgi:monoamine oxidase
MKKMIKINRRRFIFSSLSGLIFATLPKISFASNPNVVVIGAGAAGLAATGYLLEQGKSVVCIEADNRIGGRVYTDNSIFGVPYDIGAHWIENAQVNPYRKYGLKNKKNFHVYPEGEEKYAFYDGDKTLEDEDEVWKVFDAAEAAIAKTKKDIAPIDVIPNKSSEWYDTAHLIIGPYMLAKDFNHYSCKDVNNAEWGSSGDWHCQEGFGALVAHRWQNIPVQLNTEAQEIKWDGQGVQVKTNKGTISATTCIITVSTGVLSSGKIKFNPKLPEEKYEAFEGISMGVYNHIALQFKKNFFDAKEKDSYLYYKIKSQNAPSPRGFCGFTNVSGTNLSLFDTGGEFSRELEKEGEKASIDFVLNELRTIFGSKIDKYLIKGHATKWAANPLTLGSYASAEPGKAHLRDVLKQSVDDRLFFAGEATDKDWASVGGAHNSGETAAKEILKII